MTVMMMMMMMMVVVVVVVVMVVVMMSGLLGDGFCASECDSNHSSYQRFNFVST
jgi:uncharacterized membrane protein